MNKQWTVVIPSKEQRYIESQPKKECLRLLEALAEMELDPLSGDVVVLHGNLTGWRRRVGRWRILFRLDQENRKVVIVGIGARGDVYK